MGVTNAVWAAGTSAVGPSALSVPKGEVLAGQIWEMSADDEPDAAIEFSRLSRANFRLKTRAMDPHTLRKEFLFASREPR
jgi:hypothetical protein